MHSAGLVGGFVVAWGMVVAVGFLIWKTGAARVWKDNFAGMKEARDELQHKLDELIEEHKEALKLVGDQKKVIQRLEALPNLQKIIEFMAEERQRQENIWIESLKGATERIVEALDTHEIRAEQRSRAMLKRIQGDNSG